MEYIQKTKIKKKLMVPKLQFDPDERLPTWIPWIPKINKNEKP